MFSVALFFANRAIKTSNTNATLAAENAAFGNAQAAIAAEKDALAQTRSTQAAENAAIAKEQSNLAAERQIQAAVNAQIALTSIAAEALAQSREATAVYNEQLAFSRQLASQSLSFLERKTDLGTLLSIAAYQVDPSTWESRHALLTSLQTGLDQSVQPYAVMIPSTMEITNNVDISPDGKTIAWSGSGGRVVLWDVAQKKTIRELQNPSGEKITAQAFSPTDPNLLVTGSENNAITFWDLSDDSFERIEIIIVDGEERYKLNRIRFLTFNKTGDQLAVHGQNRIISIWDVATRTQIKSFADPTGADFFWQLAWSPDGNYIAAAGADNYLYIFDPQSGRAIDYARNPGREGEIYTLGWSSDSKLLAFTGRTGSQLASVYFYEIASTSVLSDYIETPASAIFSLASSFDDRLMVFAGRNEPVYVWDTSENVELARLTEYGQFQNGVSFVKNLLAYIGKNTISVYEMSVPEPLSSELPSATREVLSLSTDPQGALWIASLSGRDILLQGRSDGESQTYRLWTDLPSSSSPIHLQFTPEGLMLFVTDQAGDIYQWDPSNGQSNLVLSGLTTPLTAMAISPAGNMLAVSYCAEPTADQPEEVCTSQIQLWDLSNLSTLGQPIPTSQGIITSLIFSQDGSSLASGSQEGTILLIDTVSGKQIGLPLGDFSVNISSLAYSPDGGILAAGTDDGQLFLWDVNTGQVLGKPFRVGNDRLAGLAYAQDGLTMYSATANGQLTAWDMDLNSWKERACRIAGRDFTPEEIGNYFPGRKYKSICPEFAQATATPTP